MKKIFALTSLMICLVLSNPLFAGDYKNKDNVGNSQWTIAIRADFYDYYTPVWNDVPDSLGLKKIWYYGPSVNVWKNFGPSVALSLDLGFSDIKIGNVDDALHPPHNKHVVNFGGGLVYKFNNGYILKESAAVAPYLFGKVHGNLIKDAAKNSERTLEATIPVGLGLNVKLAENFALQMQAAYAFSLSELAEDNIQAGIGFAWDADRRKKEVEPEPIVIVVIDTDGDGIADEDDECPEEAGIAEFNGCPDTDGDGIADKNDDCPEVAGEAQYNGCPDTDGDGFSDNVDDCPEEAGVARLQGCPEPDGDGDGVLDINDKCPTTAGKVEFGGCPDSDGDGVVDGSDKCPTVPGPISNQGCPEIREEVKKRLAWAAENILFETGKATLKASSNKVLDEVAAILKEYPDYNVSVEGHTDNVGDEAKNQILSEQRAKTAADYLVSKGVVAARVSSKGFGELKPAADNATAAGRQQNRRVEFNLKLK